MSKKSGERSGYKVPGKTMITVYLPDDLLADLRKRAEDERRGLSATVQVALEDYLADMNPDTANALRAALVREGLPTT